MIRAFDRKSRAVTKHWLRTAWTWYLTRRNDMLNAATAKHYGLSPDEWAQRFPGSPVTVMQMNDATQPVPVPVVMESTPAPPLAPTLQASSRWKTPLAVAVALAIAAGAAVAGRMLGTSAPTPAKQEQAAPMQPIPSPAAPSAGTQYEAIFEQQQTDGTWKEYKRQLLKP